MISTLRRLVATLMTIMALGSYGTGLAQSVLDSIYRFYNPKTGSHFFTINAQEKDFLQKYNPDWNYEGIGFHAFASTISGLSPVHRFYNSGTGSHFFTINTKEKDFLQQYNPAWNYEGISWYAPITAASNTFPLHRFYNPTTGTHFFTIEMAEKEFLQQHNPDWKYEGIAYHVWPRLVTKTHGCSDFLSVATPIGRLSNNVWNKQAAGAYAWSQCLEQRVSGDMLQYGWSWNWPNPGATVYAYPEVIVGAKPWEPGPGNDSRFPKQISATNRLLVSYNMEINTTGDHNLAASIWLIRTPTVANPQDLSAIAVELMIWTDSTPATFVPGGTKRAEIQIDGLEWEVWAAENWGDNSGVNSNQWTYVAYRAKTPTRTITYDARKMIADAVSRGLASNDLYIADVELGNEIISGSGSAFIKSFSVTID